VGGRGTLEILACCWWQHFVLIFFAGKFALLPLSPYLFQGPWHTPLLLHSSHWNTQASLSDHTQHQGRLSTTRSSLECCSMSLCCSFTLKDLRSIGVNSVKLLPSSFCSTIPLCWDRYGKIRNTGWNVWYYIR